MTEPPPVFHVVNTGGMQSFGPHAHLVQYNGDPPPGDGSAGGPGRLLFTRRLGDSWRDLATYLGVPAYEQARFPPGDEPARLWAWLDQRGRLDELPEALVRIDRTDLIGLIDV